MEIPHSLFYTFPSGICPHFSAEISLLKLTHEIHLPNLISCWAMVGQPQQYLTIDLFVLLEKKIFLLILCFYSQVNYIVYFLCHMFAVTLLSLSPFSGLNHQIVSLLNLHS